MKKTIEITRDVLRAVRADLDAALVGIAAKHGLQMKCGGMRFTATSFTAKVEASLAGAAPEIAARYTDLAALYGMKPEWLNKTVEFAGEKFIVRGLKRGNRSVIIEAAASGKEFRAPVERFAASARLVR